MLDVSLDTERVDPPLSLSSLTLVLLPERYMFGDRAIRLQLYQCILDETVILDQYIAPDIAQCAGIHQPTLLTRH